MSNDNNRGSEILVDLVQKLKNLLTRLVVEFASWLVSEQKWRLVRQPNCDCDTLLLTTRKLRRLVIGTL